MTDRRILDSQLQDTIYQFEHKAGVVKKIDKNSIQLAESIYQGAKIVITTLQKFSFVVKKIADMEKSSGKSEKRTYEASKTMKEVLSGKTLERPMILSMKLEKPCY